ncbi:MAG: P1 family peptidase [Gemmatimonadota bacterium]|nr:P1 family peptidase [Gemmatimonadota bacterium]
MRLAGTALLLATTALALTAQKPRARALGIPFNGTPGPLNAITDVAGVEVGQVTLIRGEGRLEVGKGPVRTGVTAVLPRGKSSDPVMAAWWTLNGNGEMTGTTWVEESGYLWGPVMITNTLSVGVVHDAVIEWAVKRNYDDFLWALPVVAETYDGGLNDIKGMHVTKEHAFQALDGARPGPVAEGNVGGGTGMVCHSFKGGIGTSSRRVTVQAAGYTVGVLVQCNYGGRRRLSIGGLAVGPEIQGAEQCVGVANPSEPWARDLPRCDARSGGALPAAAREELGSIIVVVATDAPVLPHQLKRVARRVALGIGRMGGIGGDSSGDIFIAFSTANGGGGSDDSLSTARFIPNERINPIFEATVDATEEAIVNAMFAAETMTGADGYRVPALPTDQVVALLRQAGRIK